MRLRLRSVDCDDESRLSDLVLLIYGADENAQAIQLSVYDLQMRQVFTVRFQKSSVRPTFSHLTQQTMPCFSYLQSTASRLQVSRLQKSMFQIWMFAKCLNICTFHRALLQHLLSCCSPLMRETLLYCLTQKSMT